MAGRSRDEPEPLHAVLLREIEAYLAASGMSAVQFGRETHAGNTFVYDLRKDPPKYPRTLTVDRVRAFIRNNPPRTTDGKKAKSAGRKHVRAD